MSASQDRALEAIAFELVAALEMYDQAVDEMVSSWLDMDRYHSVSKQIEHIRKLCAALPGVSVPWVALLISHTELVHCLWKCGQKISPPPDDFDTCRARHSVAVAALRERCVWLFSKLE